MKVPQPVKATLKITIIRKDGTVEELEPIEASIEAPMTKKS